MASCSTEAGSAALASLSSNLERHTTLRQTTGDGRAAGSASFRMPIAPKASSEWRSFARSSHDPIASTSSASSFASSSSPRNATLSDWLDTFHRTSDAETEWLEEDVKSESSWKWSPEVQTAVEVTRAIASSPALSASSYECPTPEEVRKTSTSVANARRLNNSAAHRADEAAREDRRLTANRRLIRSRCIRAR